MTENNSIRRPTKPIFQKTVQDIAANGNKTFEPSYPFIDPAVAPRLAVKMVRGKSLKDPGPTVYRPVPLQDWSKPESPCFTQFLDNDGDEFGSPQFGSWLCRFSCVFNFGLRFVKSVSIMLSTPTFDGPSKYNPYKIVFDFLKGRRGAIPANRPSWYALTQTNPSKKQYYAAFNTPISVLAIPCFIYRDNSQKVLTEFGGDNSVPFGADPSQPLPILFIKGATAFSHFKDRLLMSVDGKLVYGNPIDPAGGYLFYTQCGGYDYVSRAERQSKDGYTLSLSREYYRQDGSHFPVNTTISPEMQQDLLQNKSFPWWSGEDYDGIFREQPAEEIVYLMAKAFPEAEEVYRHVLEPSYPELFSDRVCAEFDAIPKSERTNVDFAQLIDHIQMEETQRAEGEKVANADYNAQASFMPRQTLYATQDIGRQLPPQQPPQPQYAPQQYPPQQQPQYPPQQQIDPSRQGWGSQQQPQQYSPQQPPYPAQQQRNGKQQAITPVFGTNIDDVPETPWNTTE